MSGWIINFWKGEKVEKMSRLVHCWLGIDYELRGHLTESAFYSEKASPVVDLEVVACVHQGMSKRDCDLVKELGHKVYKVLGWNYELGQEVFDDKRMRQHHVVFCCRVTIRSKIG